jgi:NTP pyrophosphatase (non-canonical NTP hydrolase)
MIRRQPLPHIRREQKRLITPHRPVPLRHTSDPVKNPQNPHPDTPASPPRTRPRWIAEAFDAWRKGREDLGEELADVAIYLLGLAEMTGVDLQDEIEAKMAKNAARVYQRLPNGVLAKSNGNAD